MLLFNVLDDKIIQQHINFKDLKMDKSREWHITLTGFRKKKISSKKIGENV